MKITEIIEDRPPQRSLSKRTNVKSKSKFTLIKQFAPFVSSKEDFHAIVETSDRAVPVFICSHNASPVYGCKRCGIQPFALQHDQNYTYNITVPVQHGQGIRVDKPTAIWHWYGPALNFPTPTIGSLQDTSTFLIASVTFLGGIGAVTLGPTAGIVAGGVSSFIAAQNTWAKMVDKGYGVELTFPFGLPIGIPRALPPPQVEMIALRKENSWPYALANQFTARLKGSHEVAGRSGRSRRFTLRSLVKMAALPLALICLSSAITAYVLRASK